MPGCGCDLGQHAIDAVISSEHQVLDEELHHAFPIDRGVALIGTNLHIKTFSGALERLNQLHGVVGMHVAAQFLFCKIAEHY